MEIFGYACAILIGLTLGLIGGGGSILTIPILVYLFGVNPKLATSYSLFVVGFTAAIGAIRHYRMGNIKINSAILFAIPSLVTLIFVRKMVLPAIPDEIITLSNFTISKDFLIMVLFALLMIAASYSMIKKKKTEEINATPNSLKIVLVAAIVGLLTGFLGAGGGFLIIPALLFFTGINMKQAVGTSLLIIAFNSLLGFLGDVINGVAIDYKLLLTISAFATIGIFIGTMLSKKIDGAKLKPAFGWFVLVMGIYIILQETIFK